MDNTTVVQVQEVEVVVVAAFVPCCKALVSGSKTKGKALDEAAELFLAITDFKEQLNALKMLARAYQKGQEIEGEAVSKDATAVAFIRRQMAKRNPDFKLLSQSPEAEAKRAQREAALPLVTDATDDETKNKPKALKPKVVAGQTNFLHELADALKAFTDGGCSRNPEGFRQMVSAFMVSAVQNEIGIEKTK
jgi:hypothetical protein